MSKSIYTRGGSNDVDVTQLFVSAIAVTIDGPLGP